MRLVLGLLFVASLAFAGEEPSDAPPGVREGGWSVSGLVGFGYGTASGFFMVVNPRVEHFVRDRLSVGGRLDSEYQAAHDGQGYLALGPSATWHPFEYWRLRSVLGSSLLIRNIVRSKGLVGTGFPSRTAVHPALLLDLGMSLLVSPRVELGPVLDVEALPEPGYSGTFAIRFLF